MNPHKIYKRTLTKPDGRPMHLYAADQPVSDNIVATSPRNDSLPGSPHLRWHPLREEWVAYASHRQNRTFLPPKEFNPLAPTTSNNFPTELPQGTYDVAVFENLFPSLGLNTNLEGVPELFVPTAAGKGVCEVVVFTKDPNTSLGRLPLSQLELILEVWKDRYQDLSQIDEIKYILPFENRGVEMGVTLHHPHSQIYSYPFIPPLQKTMLHAQTHFYKKFHKGLLEDLIEKELEFKRRVIWQEARALAFVPVCARYPYEVWIAPLRKIATMNDLTFEETRDLAKTLKAVLLKYDNLWQKPFPYLMALYAAPCDGEDHPEWHFHIEFYPPYRSRDRLKFLAGTELAAGLFINDTLPEDKAAELRQVTIELE